MSIWSTFLWMEPVAECAYGPGDGAVGGIVELASAWGWYDGDGIRVSVSEPVTEGNHVFDAHVVLNREQIVTLRDALTGYLGEGSR